MKKDEFMSELESHLIGISKEDKLEILQDYEEHFKIGKKKKRTEAEISRSLGDPKQIARDVRRELSGPSGAEDLKNEAIETFVAAKKLTKHVFVDVSDKVVEFVDNFNNNKYGDRNFLFWGSFVVALIFMIIGLAGNGFLFFISLLLWGYLIISHVRNKKVKKVEIKQKQVSKKRSKKISPLKLILVILFNLLIFIGVWGSVFCALIALFISSIVSVLSGFVVFIFAIFGLIRYNSQATIDLLFSSLFAGVGVGIFGVLFTYLFERALGGFFKLTKKYFELNLRFIRK